MTTIERHPIVTPARPLPASPFQSGHRPGGFTDYGSARLFKSTDGFAMIRVRGRVDLDTAPELLRAVRNALMDGARLVFVDLAQVSFLAAAGATVLMEARCDCQRRDANLLLLRPSPAATRVLKFTDLLKPTAVSD